MKSDDPTNGLTYAESGVDIAAADAFVEKAKELAATTSGAKVVPATTAFAGLVRAPVQGMAEPLIAATCDGVGTKLLVARLAGQFRGLGQDLVAMNVNDLLPVGARPLFFLDYVAMGKLDPGPLLEVVEGAAGGCREAGCVLLGGETAEMPGLYRPGDFDLAGFAVGVVDAARLPKPERIATGDVILGLPSSGLHASGFSLARAALFETAKLSVNDTPEGLGRSLGDALLEPTRIYVRPFTALAERVEVKASAHITGGGLLGRAAALAPGHRIRIDPDTYRRPVIFDLVARAGKVADAEMAATFNMGLGYLAILAPQAAAEAEQVFGDTWLRVGEVVAGETGVDLGYAHT